MKMRTVAQGVEQGFNLTGFRKIEQNQPQSIPGDKKLMVNVLSVLLALLETVYNTLFVVNVRGHRK